MPNYLDQALREQSSAEEQERATQEHAAAQERERQEREAAQERKRRERAERTTRKSNLLDKINRAISQYPDSAELRELKLQLTSLSIDYETWWGAFVGGAFSYRVKKYDSRLERLLKQLHGK